MEYRTEPYIYTLEIDGKTDSYYTEYEAARSAMEKRAEELRIEYSIAYSGYVFSIEHMSDGSINLKEKNNYFLLSYESVRHIFRLELIKKG